MEQVKLRLPPAHEETLAELELLQFEQDLLRAKVADYEDQELYLGHMQRQLDDAAAQIVALRFNLRAEQRAVEQLTGQREADRHAIEATELALRKSEAALRQSQADLKGMEQTELALQQELRTARAQIDSLQTELKTRKSARITADSRLQELQTALAQAQQTQQALAGRLAESESGRLAAQKQQAALARTTELLKADKESLLAEREVLELDLLGVLRKLGSYPQGVLFRRVPGYRRLLERYRNKLSAP